MRRLVVAWGPAAVWAAVLYFASSRPTLPVDLSGGYDKIAHFAAYLVFGLLATRATDMLYWSPVVALLVGCTYGALDELHQSTVPGRMASAGDWLADSLGTATGVALFVLYSRNRNAKQRSPRSAPRDTPMTEETR